MSVATQEKKSPTQERTFLTTQEVADRWGVSMKFVRKLMQSGQCPKPIRIGVLIMFPTKAIEEFERQAFEQSIAG